MYLRAAGRAGRPRGVRGWVPPAFLAVLFVWAAAPGRSPSFLEEALLSPWTSVLGLAPSLFGVEEAGPREATDRERQGWAALHSFETRTTQPSAASPGVTADVLARRGPPRRRDMLLLSVPLAPGRVEVGDPCLVGRVLVGFVDSAPPRSGRRSLFSRLARAGDEPLPDNAWVRLLHSAATPWPEPLRLEVRLGQEADPPPGRDGIRAVVGPVREEDPFPLRLLHPAALERPRPGLHVFAWEGVGPLARVAADAGWLVGRVAESPERPDLCFVQPAIDPNAIHRVHVFSRSGGKIEPDSAERGPLERGTLVRARVAAVLDADTSGATLLLLAGSLSGVRPGAAVVRGWSLAGLVAAVGPWHSRVVLPEDPAFRMRVLVARPAGPETEMVVALVRGEVRAASGGSGRLHWWPDRDAGPLQAGDRLWSAPGGLDLPKGLLLGRVARAGPPGRPQTFELGRPQAEAKRPGSLEVFRFQETGRGGGQP